MFAIDPKDCTNCGECVKACPCDAIIEENGTHKVIDSLCVECGGCLDVCEFGAVFEGTLEEIKNVIYVE